MNGDNGSTKRAGTLRQSEVDDFLRFLFFDIARRPAPLTMRECMQVGRYLDWVAQAGVPKEALRQRPDAVRAHRNRDHSREERDKKRCVKHMADLLWGRVRTMNAHQVASNQHALRFLQRHQQTHFANPFIGRTLDLLEDFDVPADDIRPRIGPSLVSSSIAALGGKSRLQSDLSERLFAAHHALKSVGLHRTRPRIAQALNECGTQPQRRGSRDASERAWLPDDVHELVKSFEKRLRRRFAKVANVTERKDLMQRECDRAVDRWIQDYRRDCTAISVV
jgi:hypothetical protein